MKLAWLVKWHESDSWMFQLEEPDYCFAKKQIVYAEILEAP